MRRPRALFFDLDDTLIDDRASSLRSLALVREQILEPLLPGLDAIAFFAEYRRIADEYWNAGEVRYQDQATSRFMLWKQALGHFGYHDEALALHARDAYSAFRLEKPVLFEDALPLLQQIQGRFALAIITNGGEHAQRGKLADTGLERFFDTVVTSDGFGSTKPDPAIFQYAARQLGAAPDDCWHIGDSLGNDVKGALVAGLNGAVWLNRLKAVRASNQAVSHAEIATLADLPALLEAAA